MGFLDKVGLGDVEAPVSDFSIPNGVYPATISDSKIMNPKKDPSKELWQITYTIDGEVETYAGRSVSEFYDLDPNLSAERKGWMKLRLQSLGISDEEANEMDPSDIIGTDVMVTVKNRTVGENTYTNVGRVTLRDTSTVAAASYLGNF